MARGEMLCDLVGAMVHIDYRAVHPGCLQAVEHMVDQRFACQRHQRFRLVQRGRSHAGAETRSKHHCGFDLGHDLV